MVHLLKELCHGNFAVFQPELSRSLLEQKSIALKFFIETSVYFLQEEYVVVHVWFCLGDGFENFEKLRLR